MPSSQPAGSPSIRFSLADLDLFSRASHDFNPLHVSAEYARRTVFGQQVVFGVLGCLAAASHLPDRNDLALAEISAIFHGPLFVDIDYQVEVQTTSREQSKILIRDADRLITTITFQFAARAQRSQPARSCQPRQTAASHRLTDLTPGMGSLASYAPDPVLVDELLGIWQLVPKGIAGLQVATLLWSSYFIGMELPGERAAFFRLRLTFSELTKSVPSDAPLDYSAKITGVDTRFDVVHLEANLARSQLPVAIAQLSSAVLSDPPTLDLSELLKLLPASNALQDKVALVTGGTRGLGAALVAALVSQGCQVLVNFRRGHADAEALGKAVSDLPGRMHLIPGDAGDLAWCETLPTTPSIAAGGLDFLFLNASPLIRPARLTPAGWTRIADFIDGSLRLVTAPLTTLLDPLAARQGRVVLISSEYARTSPANFSHYVAAKRAAEGFAESAVRQCPGVSLLIVRPPRMLTDQTNTRGAREGTIRPESVAAAVIGRLCSASASEPQAILEQF